MLFFLVPLSVMISAELLSTKLARILVGEWDSSVASVRVGMTMSGECSLLRVEGAAGFAKEDRSAPLRRR